MWKFGLWLIFFIISSIQFINKGEPGNWKLGLIWETWDKSWDSEEQCIDSGLQKRQRHLDKMFYLKQFFQFFSAGRTSLYYIPYIKYIFSLIFLKNVNVKNVISFLNLWSSLTPAPCHLSLLPHCSVSILLTLKYTCQPNFLSFGQNGFPNFSSG